MAAHSQVPTPGTPWQQAGALTAPLARELFTLQNKAVYELYERNKAEAAVATASFMGFFSPAPLKFYDPDIKT